MKKCITIVLAFCYFTVSSGMVVNIHYCMGKISAVKTSTSSSKKKCGCKASAIPKKCCSNETKLLKAPSHNVAKHEISFNNTVVNDVVFYNDVFSISSLISRKTSQLWANAPPINSTKHLYLLNCVFLI